MRGDDLALIGCCEIRNMVDYLGAERKKVLLFLVPTKTKGLDSNAFATVAMVAIVATFGVVAMRLLFH